MTTAYWIIDLDLVYVAKSQISLDELSTFSANSRHLEGDH